jgi:hypothetical protein
LIEDNGGVQRETKGLKYAHQNEAVLETQAKGFVSLKVNQL